MGRNNIAVIRDPLLPVGAFGFGAAVEVRYPTNLHLFDTMGKLSHALDELHHAVSLTPQSSIEMIHGSDRAISRITPDAAVFLQAADEQLEGFLERIRVSWGLMQETLVFEEVGRVGVRSPFLFGFDTVEQAVQRFKVEFFDYYAGLLAGIGKPTEVRTQVRFADWKHWNGVPLELAVNVTPIHVLPDLQKQIEETKYAGALLVDLDRYAVGPLTSEAVIGLVDFALAAGISAAGEIHKRLGDDERSASESA